MDRKTLGHYTIESELGRGGMGVVYKAFDPSLNRHVAIKVLSKALADDQSVVERFNREARSMASLNDPHIIQIFFIGEDQGTPYFAMEYVSGESLSQRLKRDGKLSVADANKILIDTARGLATAHAHAVIHRDIKPGNLMISDSGQVKIADFGIAKVQDGSERLTNTGEFVGTPGYLSPEVCIGQEVDHRSDIFALGIVYFEMLTGQIPFTEASPLGMMLEVVKADIPDVRTINAEVDERSCNILNRMIAKDPEQRYQSCEELLSDLTSAASIGKFSAAPAGRQPSAYQNAATSALNLMEAGPVDAAPAQAETMISTPGQALRSKQEVKKSSGLLPLGIAALLVLGMAAGSMYLFKDRIFGNPGAADAQSINLVQDLDQIEDPGTADGAAVFEAKNPSLSEYKGGLEAPTAPPPMIVSSDDDRSSGASLANNQAVASDVVGIDLLDAAPTPGSAPQTVQIATPVEEIAKQGQSSPLRLATASTPAQARLHNTPPPPAIPRLVVIAIGDRSIAGPVEQLLEDALTADGYQLMDEAFFDGIGQVASNQGVDLPGLSRLIQANGATVLVLAQIDYLGETGLEYYGQYSTLYSVNVKIRNILLSEQRSIGRGWQQKIDFTSLNAGEKAKEAVGPYLNQLTNSLKEYRG